MVKQRAQKIRSGYYIREGPVKLSMFGKWEGEAFAHLDAQTMKRYRRSAAS